MSVVDYGKNKIERRAFPRVKAQCPLHYFTQEGGTWSEATLEDYSASGVCFYSNETLLRDTKITIQITRDACPKVPALAASATVLRCDLDEGHRFRIVCKLTRVRDEIDRKQHYLRR